MSKFLRATIPFFDSSIANFKVAVEAILSKPRQDGTPSMNCYISAKQTAVINPSIFLVFTYRGNEKNNMGDVSVYTSYPHLYKIRRAFNAVKDMLDSNAAFRTDENNVLVVNPAMAEAVVIDGIGKDNKFIALRLQVINSENGGQEPGVSISLAGAEYSSVLTADEFMAIWAIVTDINLMTIHTILGCASFDAAPMAAAVPPAPYGYQQPMNGYSQPQQRPGYQQPAGGNRYNGGRRTATPNYQQPQQGGYQQPAGYNPAPNPSAGAPYAGPQTISGQPSNDIPFKQAPAQSPDAGYVPPQPAGNSRNPINMSEVVAGAQVENITWDNPDATIDAIFNTKPDGDQ